MDYCGWGSPTAIGDSGKWERFVPGDRERLVNCGCLVNARGIENGEPGKRERGRPGVQERPVGGM